jgi:hypothetical protein
VIGAVLTPDVTEFAGGVLVPYAISRTASSATSRMATTIKPILCCMMMDAHERILIWHACRDSSGSVQI